MSVTLDFEFIVLSEIWAYNVDLCRSLFVDCTYCVYVKKVQFIYCKGGIVVGDIKLQILLQF